MAEEEKHEKWLAEFREAGVGKVRGELLQRRWPKDKLSLARVWVEREDTKNWQAARGTGEGRPLRHDRKWISYVVAAAGLGFAAFRAFRLMRHGF
jgi:hypothetical protein